MSSLHVWVRVGGEDYALPVEDVLEVADLGEIAPVPGAHPAVLGVRNLRGLVMPVVDLASVFGLPPSEERQRIVIAEHKGLTAGLAVDSIVGVEHLPEPSEEVDSPHLLGAALADGTLVGVVSVGSVFDAVHGAPVR